MSSTPREPDPQEWPTYPGGMGQNGQPGQGGAPGQGSAGQPQPYANPGASGGHGYHPHANHLHGSDTPQDDDAYRAYQDYTRGYQSPPEPGMAPYAPTPDQQDRSNKALQQKWLWIIGGIVAALVITGVAQSGNFWGLIIFLAIAWWIWNRRKK